MSSGPTGSSSPEFVRPSGAWSPEMVPGAQDWQRFDVAQWKSVNGDLGGNWAPSKPIVVGGAGMALTTSASLATGGVSTATGGRIIVAASAGDFPQLSPPRSRTLSVPLWGNCFVPADFGNPGTFQWVESDTLGWGLKATGSGAGFVIEVPGRYMHIGSTITQASLVYVVTSKPIAVPSTPAFLIMYAVDDTNTQFYANPSILAGVPSFGLGNVGEWLATHAFTSGQYIVPVTPPVGELFYYKCTTPGTTAGTEPTYPTTVGGTVTDGSVVWTCVGLAGALFGGGETPNTFFSNGAPQTLTMQYDGTGSGSYTNAITADRRYSFIIEELDPTILITGLELTFGNITSMTWE